MNVTTSLCQSSLTFWFLNTATARVSAIAAGKWPASALGDEREPHVSKIARRKQQVEGYSIPSREADGSLEMDDETRTRCTPRGLR